MNLIEALSALKDGKKIRRVGWKDDPDYYFKIYKDQFNHFYIRGGTKEGVTQELYSFDFMINELMTTRNGWEIYENHQ